MRADGRAFACVCRNRCSARSTFASCIRGSRWPNWMRTRRLSSRFRWHPVPPEASTNTTVIGNTLTILHTDPIRVEAAHGDWTVDEGETGPGKLVLTTGSDSSDAAINVSLRGTGLTSSTILDQVWIQTWIAGSERRDRAVFRFRTNESHMRVRLPLDDGVDSSSIELAVDHRKVTVEPPDDNHGITFTVPPSPDGADSQHVVEVWYRFTAGRPARGRMTLESASLEAVDHAQRCYWQLILPRSEVVMWGSLDLSAELVWQRLAWLDAEAAASTGGS